MNAIRRLEQCGQSIWYDNISRTILRTGEMRRMVQEDGLLGVTSNPSIFEKAIVGSAEYDPQIRGLLERDPGIEVSGLIQALMVQDIRDAADELRPVYDRTRGGDGYVSIEVTPSKARDTAATIAEARLLWRVVNRRNLMIKIPATREGLPAIEQAVAEGININVTLIFSIERYEEVADAYLAGLERRARDGNPLAGVASVASVFVSRVDTLVDELVNAKIAATTDPVHSARLRSLLGVAAVANSKLVYQSFRSRFFSPRFDALRARGAAAQRPLWGSTSTKNPAYDDLLYVAPLVGPHTVNTVPPVTYAAILDHLNPEVTIEQDVPGARRVLRSLAEEGIDMGAVMKKLESDGVAAFEKSFEGLTLTLQAKRDELLRATGD